MTSDSGPERKFWQISLADLERQLGAGRNGLSSAEAAARRLHYGPNTLEERRRREPPAYPDVVQSRSPSPTPTMDDLRLPR